MIHHSLHSQASRVLTCALLLASATMVLGEEARRYPLLSSCFEDAERIGDIGVSDSVKVRYASVAGTSKGACYAVSVVKPEKVWSGFLVGADLPAIQQFEMEIRKRVPEAPRPQPPAPVVAATAAGVAKAAPPEPSGPASLSGLRGLDIAGKSVDLDAISARNVIVYFWSAQDKKSAKKAESMDYIYDQYHKPGKLEMLSVGYAQDVEQLKQAWNQTEGTWPLIHDHRGGIAKRFGVDPAKPYLLVDQSRKVVGSFSGPAELEAELRKRGFK